MFTKTEKRIGLLVISLLAIGFLSKIITGNSVTEFNGHMAKQDSAQAQVDSQKNTNSPAIDIPTDIHPDRHPETHSDNSETKSVKSTEHSIIDINNADRNKLESLPGVGPVLAKAILEYRKKNGAFQKKSDLLKVKGIGEKKLAKLSPFIDIKIEIK